MDIEGLIDFITLASCGSFSRAASLRNVTQPAFSRRIQALETAVGTALVDRKAKGFRLTPAGDRFLVHARNMADLSSRAISEARSLQTLMDDPIHIVAPAHLSKMFFPAWYKKMQGAIPGLTMRIVHQRGSNALDDLRRGLADFALVMRAKKVAPCHDFSGMEQSRVGKDKMTAFRSSHCKNADRLLMYEQGSYMNSCATAILGKRLARGNVVFETSSTGLLREMTLAGFGVAALPESVVADVVATNDLVPVTKTEALDCEILLTRIKGASNRKSEKLWAANSTPKS